MDQAILAAPRPRTRTFSFGPVGISVASVYIASGLGVLLSMTAAVARDGPISCSAACCTPQARSRAGCSGCW